MGKTIKVIGCAGVGTLLIWLLPLCLIENYGPPNGNGHSNGSNTLVIAPGAPPPAPPPQEAGRDAMMRLHRQKRYLLFPEGSSFQLVFDIIIPIIDYTNYAILGITCSVAWELPSKPPSELIENVLTRINDGTIGTVRRNGSAPDPEPDPSLPPKDPDNRATANWQAVHAPPASPPAYAANEHGSHSYYTNIQRIPAAYPYANANANSDANANGQQRQAPMPANWDARQSLSKWQRKGAGTVAGAGAGTDNWWTRNGQRVQHNWRQKQRMWGPSKWDYSYTQRPRQVLQSPPKHHIYPVFAKRRRRRSLEQDPHFERLHLQQHLSSRQLLFGKIERLYKSRRLNGTSCVLRALCESGQRQTQFQGTNVVKPQSFIMELLSAIFQLPNSDDVDNLGELELMISPHYMEAHRQQGNCRQLYGDCNHAFWLD
ncbi:uncharacterized protein LOC108050713 [Drosophila rhopaloa]|uniref:Uncharacterized protein LOC108050713 n=1 Tax=Drosophila rhopaloa TaxID=1041015 RepID=A0A6P4FKQ6_DRORH|nr:uncharacterized protein LOC108050713 [Drosophila rhopaloa]XP_016988000.1 uncharacterized protein LOC108050713 [Drosophila rhopaloa]XP_016988001.1 uncharacterized protein LOC108050713 [Drosophila rhopaloa]XP_044314513.1 uncharacterized protein LOC108050713 [Drosophila rhopaloa]